MRDLIGCMNSSGSCGFPLRLVLEGKNIRDRFLLSHSTPARINGGFSYMKTVPGRAIRLG